MVGKGWYGVRRIVEPDVRESLLQSFSLFLTSFHDCNVDHSYRNSGSGVVSSTSSRDVKSFQEKHLARNSNGGSFYRPLVWLLEQRYESSSLCDVLRGLSSRVSSKPCKFERQQESACCK